METTTESSSRPLVSVIIVNYNSGHYLAECVRSLVESTYPRKELIIVDNASEDDSLAQAEALYTEARVVRNRLNLGYSGGGNIGIAKARGEFVVLMNPDAIVDPHWLEGLVDEAAHHPRAAFLQPKILLMDDQRVLNSAGNMIHIAGFGVCRGIGRLDRDSFRKEALVCYASGACTFIRTEALRQIGPMDHLFFAYGEDKDWGWRALMMGWQSIYVPSSRILHKWSPVLGHTATKFYFLEYERLLSVWKNYSKRTLVLLAPLLLLVEVSVLIYAIAKGWLPEKVQSYADLIRVRRVVAERRSWTQAQRVVNDRAVVRGFVTEIEHPYVGRASTVLNRLVGWMFAQVRNSV